MTAKIAVIGAGSWGTALANLLAENGNQVKIYARDAEVVDSINEENYNFKYFSGYKLNKNLKASNDLEACLENVEVIVISVPTSALKTVLNDAGALIDQDTIIVSTAKGIDEKSFKTNSEMIKEFGFQNVVVLSGPTHAEEVMEKLPTAIVSAAESKENAEKVQDLFMSKYFRVYTNPDVKGVELGGALKNVIAVASGICDGLNYGDNTRAALITRALNEMSHFINYHGAKTMTLSGLSGMGDLVVTCTSMHSRNRRFGIEIGKGKTLVEAKNKVKQVVEGVKTAKAIYKWLNSKNRELEMPITKEVYQVLFEDKDPEQAVEELMLRSKKHEMESVVDNSLWNI
ncbi:glycerol 3-phosphate dehydrogenase (NAD(P)+) [Halanaerobium congolense]|mgnify:CR=1 FL=1|jgi:glycerol-3-phosphate dehydrogenase (NAD(P)+)|uniref:Glycerol-3-phosphate dehydrogenase [NAD(P)+] n=1 Tax=Halanaerobium congolense TaxID=54121 RepID=A0A1M7HDZ5_9FIRM|nr:NAD(P)H-dependent glycerol-3-phosphate dehydrogenase [Halanaerobium congolense]PUU92941.1 MAG: glycerol-3-phosphate dehydrogenase (NAD(P)+) [Halanaerobium sp.]PTX16928.1 glycerol 3-phosphate dehydrogenase (NAD(P)+) [Halanaerobium congolense]TDP26876.1 glycerol 3-phosphate dehydrogenase (NAD(P)+) [Halanaerobium congolense]SDE88853.1 glycerol 3-phosphate dehydrogenase (NAD(P)+) [Halanaerobium congolense]SDH32209.1 glycerol 3-phosphate dehydrogenase (NAD(P)+) [Halanaerobium congolense]